MCGELESRQYERGEGRHKHKWKKDHAGFVDRGRGLVGKCHKSIDEVVAADLLERAIAEPPLYDPPFDDPRRLFNVYRGVPYVAVPTVPGVSWHGYPWKGRLAPDVRDALAARVEEEGNGAYRRTWREWLKRHCS